MVWLATSEVCKRMMQSSRSATALASRYVGGQSPDQAVEVALELSKKGIYGSLFYLGEYVNTEELVAEDLEAKKSVVSLLAQQNLDIHVSVDPTQLGSQLAWNDGVKNITDIAELITRQATYAGTHCVMLDMEDFTVNDATIALHDQLREQGYDAALTLQAYLRKTADDMRIKVQEGAKVRLVKGAFPAGSDIAYTTTKEIKENYHHLIGIMFSTEAKLNGFYPIIATHDHRLHAYVLKAARTNNWVQGSYEFEMLYGARDDVALDLAAQGEKIRLYLPFGKDWWPYAVRRIGENPGSILLLLRSFLSK